MDIALCSSVMLDLGAIEHFQEGGRSVSLGLEGERRGGAWGQHLG